MTDRIEQWLQWVEGEFERTGCKSRKWAKNKQVAEPSKRIWERACDMRSMSVEDSRASKYSKIESFRHLKRMHELFAEYYRTVLEQETH